MAQGTLLSLNVDLTRIENAETRRAIRSLTQQTQQILDRQQIEIDALLEILLEKHVGSIGEFKRHVQKLSDHVAERQRIHAQISQVTPHTVELEAKPADTEEPQGRQVYRL